MVANPARGQRNSFCFRFLSPFASENLVSWYRFSRPVPSPLIIQTSAEFRAYSRDFSRFLRRRPNNIPPTDIGSVLPCLLGRANTYRWRSLPSVHRHRASSPQGSSSNNGCCLFRFHHEPTTVFIMCLSFPHTHFLYLVGRYDAENRGGGWTCAIQ